jgi:hypothetical protein
MRHRLICCLAVVMSLAYTASAQAQDNIDRVQVGVPGTVTSKFSTSLSLRFTIPQGYTRECCYDFVSGAWVGPQVRFAGDPARVAFSHTKWSVNFARNGKSLASVAKTAAWAHYRTVSGKAGKVAHVISDKSLGTLPAYLAITQAAAPDARAQAVLAIDLGLKTKAIIVFTLTDPPSDTSASGAVTVNGMSASAGNLKQAKAALASVKVEGGLPLSRIQARAAGRSVTGHVTDRAGQVVPQVPLELQKRSGAKWQTVEKGMATLAGKFALAAKSAGQYRVVGTLGGASVSSRPVRVR